MCPKIVSDVPCDFDPQMLGIEIRKGDEILRPVST
jgi:hypothetical protein